MRVQHNISAINANRNLTGNNSAVSKSLEKLSSGYRINRAGDDAAGLAISEKMRAQISCLTQAETNCNDGVSLIQTAEGALTEVHSMLNRMVELAEQSANGTYTDETDRENLQSELDQLKSEVDRISKATNFNGINLLDGSLGGRDTTLTATANGVQKIVINGGGAGTVPSQLTVTLASTDLSTATLGNSTANTATGITWELDKKASQIAGDDKKEVGSTLVFKAVVDKKTASAEDAAIYEGMTAVVTVDRAKSDGTYVTTGTATTAIGDAKGLSLQIGDTADDFNKLTVNVNNMDCQTLGLKDISIATQDGASTAIGKIKSAINSVSSTRGDLGAMQNRLEHTINNLSVTNENITNAESRIRDTDMAKEMMTYTSKNILAQAAQSMLAQANQQPQQVLSLLQ